MCDYLIDRLIITIRMLKNVFIVFRLWGASSPRGMDCRGDELIQHNNRTSAQAVPFQYLINEQAKSILALQVGVKLYYCIISISISIYYIIIFIFLNTPRGNTYNIRIIMCWWLHNACYEIHNNNIIYLSSC